MQTKLIKISVLALSMGLVGGCADVKKIEAAQAAADAAMARANEAYNLAQIAHTVGSEANGAAIKAQADATAALNCCNENSAKLDRMFEKAMQK